MATYTKKLTIKINGDSLQWKIDPDNGNSQVKDEAGFELTIKQLEQIEELTKFLIETCSVCPDVTSIEYGDI